MSNLPAPSEAGTIEHLDVGYRRAAKRIWASRVALVARTPLLAIGSIGLVALAVLLAVQRIDVATLVMALGAYVLMTLVGCAFVACFVACLAWIAPGFMIWGGRRHRFYMDPVHPVFLRVHRVRGDLWRIDNHVKARSLSPEHTRQFRRRVLAAILDAAAVQGVSVEFTTRAHRLARRYAEEIEGYETYAHVNSKAVPGTFTRPSGWLTRPFGIERVRWTPRVEHDLAL